MPFETPANTVLRTTLADYTNTGLILPRLHERDTAGIIGELSRALQGQGFVPDLLPFYHAALNSELLTDTASDSGVAFPHARCGGIKRLQFAFGCAPEPVAWGADGSWRVQLVFLLAVPATDAAQYLHLLASLGRLSQLPSTLQQLRRAGDAGAILDVLEGVPIPVL